MTALQKLLAIGSPEWQAEEMEKFKKTYFSYLKHLLRMDIALRYGILVFEPEAIEYPEEGHFLIKKYGDSPINIFGESQYSVSDGHFLDCDKNTPWRRQMLEGAWGTRKFCEDALVFKQDYDCSKGKVIYYEDISMVNGEMVTTIRPAIRYKDPDMLMPGEETWEYLTR